MINTNNGKRNRAMFERALARWTAQGNIPNSPGAFDSNGNYELCLGALLAESATGVLLGEPEASAFVSRLAAGGTKAVIVEQFVHLGWPAEFAMAKIIFNDLTSQQLRKTSLRCELETLEMPLQVED